MPYRSLFSLPCFLIIMTALASEHDNIVMQLHHDCEQRYIRASLYHFAPHKRCTISVTKELDTSNFTYTIDGVSAPIESMQEKYRKQYRSCVDILKQKIEAYEKKEFP